MSETDKLRDTVTFNAENARENTARFGALFNGSDGDLLKRNLLNKFCDRASSERKTDCEILMREAHSHRIIIKIIFTESFSLSLSLFKFKDKSIVLNSKRES